MTVKETTREEHLSWCKSRAMELLDFGDINGAFTSFASDVGKHPETEGMKDVITKRGLPLLMSGHLGTEHEMREHINGYN